MAEVSQSAKRGPSARIDGPRQPGGGAKPAPGPGRQGKPAVTISGQKEGSSATQASRLAVELSTERAETSHSAGPSDGRAKPPQTSTLGRALSRPAAKADAAPKSRTGGARRSSNSNTEEEKGLTGRQRKAAPSAGAPPKKRPAKARPARSSSDGSHSVESAGESSSESAGKEPVSGPGVAAANRASAGLVLNMMHEIIDEINPFSAQKLSLHKVKQPDRTKLMWAAFQRNLQAAQPNAKAAPKHSHSSQFWETRRNVSGEVHQKQI